MRTSIIKNKINFKKIAIKAGVVLFWLLVWQLAFKSVSQELLIVAPVKVFKRIFELSLTMDFWLVVFSSFGRIMLGFLLAVIVGAILAVLTTSISFLNELFSPLLTVIKSTPVASFIILALVWLKSDILTAFIVFLMVIPLVWSNLSKGIESTDKNLLEMAKLFKLSNFKKVRFIFIPSVMPYFVAACTTGLGFAWKAGIAAEVLGLPKNSIGLNLYNSKIYLETADVFAWTVVIIVISVVIEKVLLKLLKLATKNRTICSF